MNYFVTFIVTNKPDILMLLHLFFLLSYKLRILYNPCKFLVPYIFFVCHKTWCENVKTKFSE